MVEREGPKTVSVSKIFPIFISFSLCLAFLSVIPSYASSYVANSIHSYVNKTGIKVMVNDIELYFNATNGGEITQYYDLFIDPNRSRNLVNNGWEPYYNLLPLFTSLFYNPYSSRILSTGGDSDAMVSLIANSSEYVILQTSSRIMSRSGEIAKDAYGNVILINSTWVIRSSGLVSVERIFSSGYVNVPSGWRWYPFYLTRTVGFDYNGTFLVFNTTSTFISVVNEETYSNAYSSFPIFPNDTNHVFGVAAPFSNMSIGGDGGHNILMLYKHDELFNIDEWKSDNYQSSSYGVTEFGAIHEFSNKTVLKATTYHIVINFTHEPLNEIVVQNFAKYYASNTSMSSLMNCSVTTNKQVYSPGDSFVIYGSGTAYYNLTGLMAKLIIKNSLDGTIYQQSYGPGNITSGQLFFLTLLTGKVGSDVATGNYAVTFQILSSAKIMIASDSEVITVIR